MTTTLQLLMAAALSFALSAHAGGNAEAGKAKSSACAACHGYDGNSKVPAFPRLAGQHRDYLFHALRAYKDGTRKNPVMAEQVKNLSTRDMGDLAAYFSSQKQDGLYTKY